MQTQRFTDVHDINTQWAPDVLEWTGAGLLLGGGGFTRTCECVRLWWGESGEHFDRNIKPPAPTAFFFFFVQKMLNNHHVLIPEFHILIVGLQLYV